MFARFKTKRVQLIIFFVIILLATLFKIDTNSIHKQHDDNNVAQPTQTLSSVGHVKQFFSPTSNETNNEESLDFKIKEIIPEVYRTEVRIRISCNKDVDLYKIKGYIDVKPKINFIVERSYRGIVLRGDFKVGSTYEIEVLKGMPSAKGAVITKTFNKTIVIPDYEPTLSFKETGIYMSLQGKQTIPLEIVNVDAIKVKALKVYDNNIVYLINNMDSYRSLNDMGFDAVDKELNTGCEINKTKELMLDLHNVLPKDAKGIYFLNVNGTTASRWQGISKLVLITDLGIVAKKSSSDLLVWLNSLGTNKAIANATVRVYSKTNQQLLEGTTDNDGLVHFKGVDWSLDRKPFAITATSGNDVSFLEFEKSTISETDFNIQGMPYIGAGYESFLYTDRGIYRPGEKIHFRAVIRNAQAQTPEKFPILIEIKRPDGKQFTKISSTLSAFGSADLEVDIPDYAATGIYTANVLVPGNEDEAIGSVKFNVEEFMPDRLNVTIDTSVKRFGLTEEMPVVVKAEQSFGVPAEGRRIDITCNLRAADFKPVGFNDYIFTDKTNTFISHTINVGEKESDLTGSATFAINFPQYIKPSSALVGEINAVVKEIGGRAVTVRTERDIDAYPYYIGIKKAKEGYAALNQAAKFNYVVLAADGKKITKPELIVNIYKLVWNNVLKKDEHGEFKYIAESKEELVLQDVIKQGDTSQSFSFTPKLWGDYIIKIHGKEENTHTTSLAFYSSDSGYMPWAMDKPDRLDLTFDKTSYKAGDTAKLAIKSPFKGRALITISKDQIVTTKIVDLVTETQEIPITITEDFAPNAYCAVTVIRPILPNKDMFAYRAYGIVPLAIDNNQHKLEISVESPLTTLPKQRVKVKVNVKQADGKPAKAELSMALVDEGILSLTRFNLPDPHQFFYGQRANKIATSDIYSLIMPEFSDNKLEAESTPSGDSGVLAGMSPNQYKKHLNPINVKRVKPVVLWKTGIVTDNKGNAVAEFNIPEFSGNLKLTTVAIANDNFGNQQADLQVTAPLIVQSNLPRILATNDEFIVPISLFNTTNKDVNAEVSMDVSAGFVILETPSVINIKAGKEAAVNFKLKAPAIPGKAEFKIKATAGDQVTEETVEIAVRPPLPFTVFNGAGAIKAPNMQDIKMPFDWLGGTGELTLTVTPLPALQFAGGIKFLLSYPHGCLEQVVSKAMPLLYLKDIADLAIKGNHRYSQATMDNYVNAAIQQVLTMQTYNGSFSLWPDYKQAYDWGSIYATDFLVEAERAGYIVPTTAKKQALNYCEQILTGTANAHKAYSVFVLAKAGRIKPSWIRRLQEVKDTLSGCSKFYLTASLYLLGDKTAASEILGTEIVDKKIARQTDDSLNSYTRENAVALSVYMDIDPNNPMVPVLVNRLQSTMHNGAWDTTQENAAALVALGKYASFIKQQETSYTGTILQDGKVIASFNEQKSVALDKSMLANKEIKISLQGKGQAYYYWNSEGIPASGTVEEKHKGIKASRKYFTRTGEPLDIEHIKQGDAIVVDIAIETEVAHNNIVIEDILPAGFEIENPRIASSETLEWIKIGIFEPQHIDIRDDRLLVFTDLPKNKNLHYRYIVRAVTTGKFFKPALSVSCMYDPSIVSVSGQGTIEIRN